MSKPKRCQKIGYGFVEAHWFDARETDRQEQGWALCENAIIRLNLLQHFIDHVALLGAEKCWRHIKNNLIDYEFGEWYWGITEDSKVNAKNDKVGFWEWPYHNCRMCLEIIERFH